MKSKYYCFECEYCTGGKIIILGQAMCVFFNYVFVTTKILQYLSLSYTVMDRCVALSKYVIKTSW